MLLSTAGAILVPELQLRGILPTWEFLYPAVLLVCFLTLLGLALTTPWGERIPRRTRECPPDAIAEHKQMVRGVERWYVDFDKFIPYFAESASCGICTAVCPWTRPDVRPKLLATMAGVLVDGQTGH